MRNSNLAIAGAASALSLYQSALKSGALHYVRADAGDDVTVEMRKAIAEVKTGMQSWTDKQKAAWTEFQNKLDAAMTEASATKKISEDTIKKLTEAQARVADLEQKYAGLRPANDNPAIKTPGMKFIDDAKVKAFCSDRARGRIRVVTNTITSLTTGDGSAGDLIVPQRQAGIIEQRFRRLRIRDLLPVGRTTSNSIEFVQETGFVNNAAPVEENPDDPKPTSELSFDLQTAPVRTIAHIMKASTQILQDVPQLQSFIDTRLRIGLAIEEEDQLLSGNGVGQNLLGLIPQATPFDTARKKVGDTRIDIVRRAMTQLRLSEYQATAIVMHPTDWEEVELTKETGTGAYVWANPRGLVAPTLWGLPVVDSTALQEGEFMIGAFDVAAQIWDRQEAIVELATENEDDFVKNLVTIRGEERIALTVYRPESFIYGDFDDIVSS